MAFICDIDREMGTDKNKHMKVNFKSATTIVTVKDKERCSTFLTVIKHQAKTQKGTVLWSVSIY